MTTKTKTEPKNNQKSISDLARASRELLTAAQDQAEAREVELDDARRHVEEVLAAWRSGNTSIPPDAIGTARNTVERGELLLAHAVGAVKVALQGLINDESNLAEVFAPPLAAAAGLTVVVTTVFPDNSSAESPTLYLVQAAPSLSQRGSLSGELTVMYFRGPLFGPLDQSKVEREIKRAGFLATVSSLPVSKVNGPDGLVVDRMTIRVQSAFALVPAITNDVDEQAARDVARSASGYLLNAFTKQGEEPIRYMGDPHVIGKSVSIKAHRVATSTIDKGIREATFEVKTQITPNGYRFTPETLRAEVAQGIGRLVPGVGRVTDAKVIGVEDSRTVGTNPHAPLSLTVTTLWDVTSQKAPLATMPKTSSHPGEIVKTSQRAA